MTREEALKKLADIIFNAAKNGYMPYDTNDELCAMQIAKKHIDDFYTSLPSNLDEAAEEWAKILYGNPGKSAVSISGICGFKAGAEWMAKQGITVTGDTDDEYVRILKDIEKAICKIAPDSIINVQIRK